MAVVSQATVSNSQLGHCEHHDSNAFVQLRSASVGRPHVAYRGSVASEFVTLLVHSSVASRASVVCVDGVASVLLRRVGSCCVQGVASRCAQLRIVASSSVPLRSVVSASEFLGRLASRVEPPRSKSSPPVLRGVALRSVVSRQEFQSPKAVLGKSHQRLVRAARDSVCMRLSRRFNGSTVKSSGVGCDVASQKFELSAFESPVLPLRSGVGLRGVGPEPVVSASSQFSSVPLRAEYPCKPYRFQ